MKEMREKDRKVLEEFFGHIETEILKGFNVKDAFGISKNFYSVLGLIAAEWARVEELLGYLCFLPLGIEPPIGVPLTANLGYRSRVQILHSFSEIAARAESIFGVQNESTDGIKKKAEEIKKVLCEIEEVYPKRNEFLHCSYTEGAGENDARMSSVRVKGKLKYDERLVTCNYSPPVETDRSPAA